MRPRPLLHTTAWRRHKRTAEVAFAKYNYWRSGNVTRTRVRCITGGLPFREQSCKQCAILVPICARIIGTCNDGTGRRNVLNSVAG